MSLIYFCLVCFGLTQILVFGSIFDSIRPKTGFLGELLHCPMCTGFWVGVLLWAISPFTELFNFDYTVVNAFLLGCLSSGVSYVMTMIVCDNGIQIASNKTDTKILLGGKNETIN